MRGIVDGYMRRAEWIGVGYCAVPALAWFGGTALTVPFRSVYVLRLALCLVIGCPLAARINRVGLELWLAKHRGPDGPATLVDGLFVGAGVGFSIALLPTLTSLIATHHAAMAKTFVITTYVAAAVLGGILGTWFAALGRKYVAPRDVEP